MIEMRMDVADERLILNIDRALWWPRMRCLMLADVHFGKGSVLRKSGISVPTGQTAIDLTRLDQLIERYKPQEIIVLGDLVHGRSSLDAPWVQQVQNWRQGHITIAMRLVAGNHDRHFDPHHLGFDIINGELGLNPFVLRHAPGMSPSGYVLAGHLHPGISVRDGWRRHRFPAFRFTDQMGILPAFGSLTGLHEGRVSKAERVVAITPGGLLDVSNHRPE